MCKIHSSVYFIFLHSFPFFPLTRNHGWFIARGKEKNLRSWHHRRHQAYARVVTRVRFWIFLLNSMLTGHTRTCQIFRQATACVGVRPCICQPRYRSFSCAVTIPRGQNVQKQRTCSLISFIYYRSPTVRSKILINRRFLNKYAFFDFICV